MKSKKLLLGSLSAMALVATPIATVVSCGKKADTATYTKLSKDMLTRMSSTLAQIPTKETNAEYIKYIKRVFNSYVKKDGETSLDTTSLTKITGTTDADVTKVLEAAKKINAYTRLRKASKAEVYVLGKALKLDKVLSKAEAKKLEGKDVTIKTPGNAATSAVVAATLNQTDVSTIHGLIDSAKTEKAILDLLAKYETVSGHASLVTTSVTTITNNDVAAKLAAQKAAAKALIVASTVGTKAVSEVKEVKTVVTILGKDYTLPSFVNDQTNKKMHVVNPGLAKDVPAKLKTIKFRARIKDVATFKQAIKFLFAQRQIFADNKGKKLNFTKLDAAATTADAIKEAKALLVDGLYTTKDINQDR